MMFTEVGCDRYNSQSQESTAHQSMSIVKINIFADTLANHQDTIA